MAVERSQMGGVAGWRGRLGYIWPSAVPGKAIRHFYEVAPEGVEPRIVTLGITRLTDEEVEQALSRVDDAARRIAEYAVKFVSLLGAPLASFRGNGWDRELIRRVEMITKCPVTTDLTAGVEAFNAFSVKKIVIASPFKPELDARIKMFFVENGIAVLNVKSLNIQINRDIQELPENAAYNTAREAYLEAPDAEGIYDPCGGWGSPAVVEYLERDFGIPVVANHQACLWLALKALKIKEPVRGYGRLFEL